MDAGSLSLFCRLISMGAYSLLQYVSESFPWSVAASVASRRRTTRRPPVDVAITASPILAISSTEPRSAAKPARSRSRSTRASITSLSSASSVPVNAHNRGRARNSERGQTNVPSPTRLSNIPTSSIAFRVHHTACSAVLYLARDVAMRDHGSSGRTSFLGEIRAAPVRRRWRRKAGLRP